MALQLIRAINPLAATLALLLPQVVMAQADAAAERQEDREERQEEREEERQEQEEDQEEQAEEQEEQEEAKAAAPAQNQPEQEEAEPAAPAQSQAEQQQDDEAAAPTQSQAEQQEEAEPAAPTQSQAEQQEQDEAAAPAQSQADQQEDAEAALEAIQQGRTEADAEAAVALDAAARAEAEAIMAREAAEAKLAGVGSEPGIPLAARAEAVAAAGAEGGTSNNVTVTVETITEADIRRSWEDFATDATGEGRPGARSQAAGGLTDPDSILFLGLGAAAVGSVLENGQEVVANTGDRVVTLLDSGEYEVYRDDDVILREAGATVQTETFADGSIRTLLTREDATQVVTIRDPSSRILHRARILADGTEVELIDDLDQTAPVDLIALLETAPMPVVASLQTLDHGELQAFVQDEPVYDAGRTFSLRQVREISAVRNLMPALDLNVNFATDSAAVPRSELSDLVEMGLAIEDALAENPGEVFLIEGHADAVGGEAYNLALSDRRAESVALSLVENFNIPPENLVIQGFGEEFLRVPTEASEAENRRASLRRITPLLSEEVASLQGASLAAPGLRD